MQRIFIVPHQRCTKGGLAVNNYLKPARFGLQGDPGMWFMYPWASRSRVASFTLPVKQYGQSFADSQMLCSTMTMLQTLPIYHFALPKLPSPEFIFYRSLSLSWPLANLWSTNLLASGILFHFHCLAKAKSSWTATGILNKKRPILGINNIK